MAAVSKTAIVKKRQNSLTFDDFGEMRREENVCSLAATVRFESRPSATCLKITEVQRFILVTIG